MQFKTLKLSSFWNDLPFISSLVIAASILMYLGWLIDHSFMDLAVPGLEGIRNGRYMGLITSSLFENSILFLGWGVGWVWYFGTSVEKNISLPFSIFLLISSVVFPALFEILIFERVGYGMGGICFSIFGFTWLMSVYDPAKWPVSRAERWVAIAFIFLCILLDYSGLFRISIAGLVGGLIWGVFVGFLWRASRNKVLQLLIPTFVLGLFLVPVFWAPWQVSWLLNKADSFYDQSSDRDQMIEARELYSRVLKKDPENKSAKEKIKVLALHEEYLKFYDHGDLENAKKALVQILEIMPDSENTKERQKIILLYEEYLKYYKQQDFFRAANALALILEIHPNDEITKRNLRVVRLLNDFVAARNNKDLNAAKDALSQIREIEPDNEEAKKYLEEIENPIKAKRTY